MHIGLLVMTFSMRVLSLISLGDKSLLGNGYARVFLLHMYKAGSISKVPHAIYQKSLTILYITNYGLTNLHMFCVIFLAGYAGKSIGNCSYTHRHYILCTD